MLPFLGHAKAVRCLDFTPDGNTLASGGDDGAILIWDRLSAVVRHTLPTGLKSVGALACHPDGERLLAPWKYALAVLDSPDRLRFWNLESGKPCAVEDHETGLWHRAELLAKGPELLEIPIGDAATVSALSFRPDGESWIALHFAPKTTMYYGPNISKAIKPEWRPCDPKLEAYPSWFDRRVEISALSLSADGTTAAVASREYVRVGALDAARVPPAYRAAKPVASIALSPNADRLIGCWGNVVTVWETGGASRVREFDGHTAPVRTVAYAPDGSLAASAGLDGTVLLWEPDGGSIRVRYDWNLGPIHKLAFAPDGLTLAVAGQGGLILFDLE